MYTRYLCWHSAVDSLSNKTTKTGRLRWHSSPHGPRSLSIVEVAEVRGVSTIVMSGVLHNRLPDSVSGQSIVCEMGQASALQPLAQLRPREAPNNQIWNMIAKPPPCDSSAGILTPKHDPAPQRGVNGHVGRRPGCCAARQADDERARGPLAYL